ncbi:Diaminopimelate epimerase-like protein [Zopfia rhizophila CBS 207.26]|uniref:Diaminopimelate epimerase-like protein n=1 Tax=Zopfia rhizophila CBS 207.26 TaxID=1314779 RepID=A0A6A6EHL9_9PEZI|nr:Diaminopimelate epimerase-like protein [Zopfia rhizophila CBS 207.26]
MKLHFTTVDVFASTPFKGNPLAIITVPFNTPLSQQQKQLIAREFNLSETVFLHEQNEADSADGNHRIDIFTPFAEVPFAGHPTVGTSYYLLVILKEQNARALVPKAGRMPIRLGERGVELEVAHNVHVHDHPFKNESFGHYPVVSIVKGMTFLLAKVPDLEILARQDRNLIGTENTYTRKEALDEGWREGIVTTYFYCDLGFDEDGTRLLRTRTFGAREDPATGSAASALCSYLSLSEDGAVVRNFHLTQGVEMGRQSDIFVETTLKDCGGIEKVTLKGTATKMMEGWFEV